MYVDQQILPNIYAFRPNRETLGGTSYLIVRSPSEEPAQNSADIQSADDESAGLESGEFENVLVDCPAPTEAAIDRIKELGGVKWLLLTHRTAMGKPGSSKSCVAQCVAQLGCQVIVQEQETYLLTSLEVCSFSTILDLVPDLQCIWTPGHTPGSTCVFYRGLGGVLFTGRHLLPNDTGQLVPIRQPKTFHWSRQLRSISRLLETIKAPAPQWICPGGNLGKLRGDKMMDAGRDRLQKALQLVAQTL
ncbi:MAG: MBL fold metallo-hydrolase [Synechococcus sp.]